MVSSVDHYSGCPKNYFHIIVKSVDHSLFWFSKKGFSYYCEKYRPFIVLVVKTNDFHIIVKSVDHSLFLLSKE